MKLQSKRIPSILLTCLIIPILSIIVIKLFHLNEMDSLVAFLLIQSFFPLELKIFGFHNLYLQHDQTKTINGFFTLYIFFTHSYEYLSKQRLEHRLYSFICHIIHHLNVTTFLFFSGYGIMDSIETKPAYIQSIVRRRIPQLYLQFFFAVCLFWALAKYLSRTFTWKQLTWAFLTLGSLGNSNWYTTVIELLYFCTFISFKSFYNYDKRLALFSMVQSCVLVYLGLEYYLRRSEIYYKTLFCYPVGMLYCFYQKQIDAAIQNSNFSWTASAGVSICLFRFSYIKLFHDPLAIRQIWYHVSSISFVLSIVLISMKCKLRNPILKQLGGRNLYAYYMLQRLPMRFLSIRYPAISAISFFIISISILVFLLAPIFTEVMTILFKIIF